MRKPTPDIKYLEPALINRIADKRALDNYLRRETVVEDSLATLFFGNPDLHKSIGRVVDSLPLAEQELLKMRYWEDLTLAEISTAKGIGERAIQNLLTKILAKLRPIIIKKMRLLPKSEEIGKELKTAVHV